MQSAEKCYVHDKFYSSYNLSHRYYCYKLLDDSIEPSTQVTRYTIVLDHSAIGRHNTSCSMIAVETHTFNSKLDLEFKMQS